MNVVSMLLFMIMLSSSMSQQESAQFLCRLVHEKETTNPRKEREKEREIKRVRERKREIYR